MLLWEFPSISEWDMYENLKTQKLLLISCSSFTTWPMNSRLINRAIFSWKYSWQVHGMEVTWIPIQVEDIQSPSLIMIDGGLIKIIISLWLYMRGPLFFHQT